MDAPAPRIAGISSASYRKSSATISVVSDAVSHHSASSSMLGRGTTAVLPLPYIPFNFEAAKVKVQKAFDGGIPGQFRLYYRSELFDRLAKSCVLHFLAQFEYDTLSKAAYRAERQRLDGVNIQMVESRLAELQKECLTHLKAMCPAYAFTLLRHANFRQPHQDNLFFEALYKVLVDLVAEAIPQRPRLDIEGHIGKLFRTSMFNMPAHANQPLREVDTLSLPDLTSLKNGTSKNISTPVASRVLASLHERPNHINVQAASQSTTELLSLFLPDAARTRSLKEPRFQGARQCSTHLVGFELPPMLLDPLEPEDLIPVSVERSGMISDSSMLELQRTRRILEGKDPMAEGASSRSGSRLMSSAGLLRGSVMAQSRLASVRTAAT